MIGISVLIFSSDVTVFWAHRKYDDMVKYGVGALIAICDVLVVVQHSDLELTPEVVRTKILHAGKKTLLIGNHYLDAPKLHPSV